MAVTPPSAPGWYPDPWGTGGERHFDGRAWGTTTRPTGGTPAPGASAPADASGEPAAAGLPQAAWYPDPAGADALRWWDGRVWTEHVAARTPPSGATVARSTADVPPEVLRLRASGLARAARTLLLVAGPALAAQIVATSIALHRMSGAFLDSLDRPDGPSPLTTSSSPGLSLVSNLAGLVMLATGIVFILWLGNAGRHASARGLPLKRPAWLGAWSLVIPVVQYWFPYRAASDLLPGGHPGRGLIVRWWALWIATTLLQTAAFVFALLGGPDAVLVALAAVGAFTALLAAGAARAVIAAVESAHRKLAGVSLQSE